MATLRVKCLIQSRKFPGLAIHGQGEDGLSGGTGLGQHISAIFGYENSIGAAQKREIGVRCLCHPKPRHGGGLW